MLIGRRSEGAPVKILIAYAAWHYLTGQYRINRMKAMTEGGIGGGNGVDNINKDNRGGGGGGADGNGNGNRSLARQGTSSAMEAQHSVAAGNVSGNNEFVASLPLSMVAGGAAAGMNMNGGGMRFGGGGAGGIITIQWLNEYFTMRLKFIERELFRNLNMLQTMVDNYAASAATL